MPYNKALTMMLLEFIQVLMKNMVLVQLTNFLDDEIILRKKKYSCIKSTRARTSTSNKLRMSLFR